jgi:hypothetical protein
MPWRSLPTGALIVVAVLGLAAPMASSGATADASRGGRDPWLRPFRSDSIWNTPIGSGAEYVAAELAPQPNVLVDEALLIRTTDADPLRPLIEPRSWTERCTGEVQTGLELHVPDDWIVEDAQVSADGARTTPNHVAAILQPDGRTIVNTNAVARCEPGGPVFGYRTGDDRIDVTDLYGDGRLGSHGASRLSVLGGAIRTGELSGEVEIRHVLDVLIPADHLWWDGPGSCYRWPAEACDAYADSSTYRGWVPDLRMGALLALEPHLTPHDVGVDTQVGRRLFDAFRDYGAYVTDDAAWEAFYLTVDAEAVGTFPWGDPEQADLNAIMANVSVVANNSEESPGGPGARRRELLPHIDAPDDSFETQAPGTGRDPDRADRSGVEARGEQAERDDRGLSPGWIAVGALVVVALGGGALYGLGRRSR